MKRIMATVFAALIVASVLGIMGVYVKAETNTVQIKSVQEESRSADSHVLNKLDRMEEKIDRLIERSR